MCFVFKMVKYDSINRTRHVDRIQVKAFAEVWKVHLPLKNNQEDMIRALIQGVFLV